MTDNVNWQFIPPADAALCEAPSPAPDDAGRRL